MKLQVNYQLLEMKYIVSPKLEQDKKIKGFKRKWMLSSAFFHATSCSLCYRDPVYSFVLFTSLVRNGLIEINSLGYLTNVNIKKVFSSTTHQTC
jgi:hypothetical protein